MSNFWPKSLDLTDTQSPREILNVAQDDWYLSSNGVMELILQDATSKSGNTMIIVHAKHVPSNRTITLFSVIHRPNNPYPVAIQLDDEGLPDFLKKSSSRSSLVVTAMEMMEMNGKTISNPWVSDTPSEFRKKLAEAFNLSSITSKILNLVSDDSHDSPDTKEELQESEIED